MVRLSRVPMSGTAYHTPPIQFSMADFVSSLSLFGNRRPGLNFFFYMSVLYGGTRLNPRERLYN
jgi:hypothetical protein